MLFKFGSPPDFSNHWTTVQWLLAVAAMSAVKPSYMGNIDCSNLHSATSTALVLHIFKRFCFSKSWSSIFQVPCLIGILHVFRHQCQRHGLHTSKRLVHVHVYLKTKLCYQIKNNTLSQKQRLILYMYIYMYFIT